MQDFKSYSLDKKRSGGSFIKWLFLIVLILAVIFIVYRSLDLQTTEEHSAPPATAPLTPGQQESDRVTLPLPLPGKQPEEGMALPETDTPPAQSETEPRMISQSIPSPDDVESIQKQPAAETSLNRRITHKIVKGDTLSKVFQDLGLSANLLYRIVNSSKQAQDLTKIKPGETLFLELDSKNDLVKLTLQHSKIDSLHIEATTDGEFSTTRQSRDVELRTAHVQATIENSLYVSARDAGLPDAVIMALANIFGWDIDFALEIRTGDRFTVIYQEAYLDGEKLHNGPILAAEFVNQGRSYRAIRYEDNNGNSDYYTPDGRSLRKAFLRAPVDFRRISSRFAKERWHPVLGKKRPHRGVDYAAKTGTPIRAAGDGKILHRGTKGGYGRTVIIQHGQRYTTLYGHLSRYNKNAKRGTKVKQGQTIGYVGQSGLATGPHLHYEFRVNGVHRNPLTVKLPEAKPIAEKHRSDFLLKTRTLIAQLDTLNRIVVADAR